MTLLSPWAKLLRSPRVAWQGPPVAASIRPQSSLGPQHPTEMGSRGASQVHLPCVLPGWVPVALPCDRLPSVLPMQHCPLASQGSGQGAAQGHCGLPAPLLRLALASARCLAADCSPLCEPGFLCWGARPSLSPLSASCRPGGPRGGDCPFSYLPLCNKRPEPCSLFLFVSLPAGGSPQLLWVPVPCVPGCPAAEHVWGGGLTQAWGEHPRHLGLKPFLLASRSGGL